jgi:hypothetical protein
MTWVTEHYKNPTEAQLLAEKARKMLHELEIECSCEYGECPKEHYFEFHGHMYPSYAPVTKMCRKCELNNLLYNIQDPDDCAGSFT